MSLFQKTIKFPISLTSVGLHSGKSVTAKLCPAEENSGIVFRRIDGAMPVDLCVGPLTVEESLLCTKLVGEKTEVSTIEHMMAAFAATQIDNIVVELNAPEVPILDGSAEPIVFAIRSAGIKSQSAARRFRCIKKMVQVSDGDKFAEFSPYRQGMRYQVSIDFSHPAIRKTPQSVEFELFDATFFSEVSRARTFGAVKDLDQLHAKKLALGANLTNAVGLSDDGVLNTGGLRYPDEFVRHKLLDAIGDLYVAGPIHGNFKAHKAGHALNNRLLRALLADDGAWEWFQ